jgi:hypothetical protein
MCKCGNVVMWKYDNVLIKRESKKIYELVDRNRLEA